MTSDDSSSVDQKFLANAMASFVQILAVWGKNLTEEEYRTSAIDLAGFGYDYSHIGAPRMFGAEVTFRF